MKMTFVIMTNTDLLKVVPCKLVESYVNLENYILKLYLEFNT